MQLIDVNSGGDTSISAKRSLTLQINLTQQNAVNWLEWSLQNVSEGMTITSDLCFSESQPFNVTDVTDRVLLYGQNLVCG